MRPVAEAVGGVCLYPVAKFSRSTTLEVTPSRPVKSCFLCDAAVDHGNSHARSIPPILPGYVRIDRRCREVKKSRGVTVFGVMYPMAGLAFNRGESKTRALLDEAP